MNNLRALLLLSISGFIVSCGDSEPVSVSEKPVILEPAVIEAEAQLLTSSGDDLVYNDLIYRDERLIARHNRLTLGMSADDVSQIMIYKPGTEKETYWAYHLSPAADTNEEINQKLVVEFEGGRVSRVTRTYTCIITRPAFDD